MISHRGTHVSWDESFFFVLLDGQLHHYIWIWVCCIDLFLSGLNTLVNNRSSVCLITPHDFIESSQIKEIFVKLSLVQPEMEADGSFCFQEALCYNYQLSLLPSEQVFNMSDYPLEYLVNWLGNFFVDCKKTVLYKLAVKYADLKPLQSFLDHKVLLYTSTFPSFSPIYFPSAFLETSSGGLSVPEKPDCCFILKQELSFLTMIKTWPFQGLGEATNLVKRRQTERADVCELADRPPRRSAVREEGSREEERLLMLQ